MMDLIRGIFLKDLKLKRDGEMVLDALDDGATISLGN